MVIDVNQSGEPIVLVLLRTFDQSQLSLPNKWGRMPAQKRLVDTYSHWPDTDPEDVRNVVHCGLLLLALSLRNEVGKNRFCSIRGGALARLTHHDYAVYSRRVDPESRYDHGD